LDTLSLHDALPISDAASFSRAGAICYPVGIAGSFLIAP
jgi:hypothetical protein